MTGRSFIWWSVLVGISLFCAQGFDIVRSEDSPRQTSARAGFRNLAPGVLTIIPPDASADDIVLRKTIPEITKVAKQWDPKLAAKETTLFSRANEYQFNRNVWCLEFAFKPPRMMNVDVPVAGLKMEQKKIWYLVYRVRNTGGRMMQENKDTGQRTTKVFDTPVQFFPQFVLETNEGISESDGTIAYRAYLDRLVPTAMKAIQQREDPNRPLLDSVQMSIGEIETDAERWGVAIWEDIDPRIDFFTIFVRGLTNSMRWRSREDNKNDNNNPAENENEYSLESLRLDFWRPGDDLDESDEEINVGQKGLFERLTCGARLVAAASRVNDTKSLPAEGFAELGLDWNKLLDPAVDPDVLREGISPSLKPLATILSKINAMKSPADRGEAVRKIFGDFGDRSIESLASSIAKPEENERAGQRSDAFKKLGLDEQKIQKNPLEGVIEVINKLDAIATPVERYEMKQSVFGQDARSLDTLLRDFRSGRTVAVLDDLEVDTRRLRTVFSGEALEAVRSELDRLPDDAARQRHIQGLFGAEGPQLYTGATGVREGIDHEWVFRYETAGQ
ncbi:MAG: hypothetical protein WCR23_02955 [Planctomycetota bacterium]